MNDTQPLTMSDYHVHHPELWNRIWERHMITQQTYYAANCGKPSRRRNKINFMVNKVYDQFLMDMEKGLVA